MPIDTKSGLVSSQYNLGYMYDSGHCASQNYREAEKWYRKAAEQGHAGAQNNLGNMYWHGKGHLSKNDNEAVKWYRLAAHQGDRNGQFNFGKTLHYGRGINQDLTQAIEWYRKAAAQGLLQAQEQLQIIEQQFNRRY
ncbi:MAG: sel1 repeat family protein [Nitrosomonas sp.]|nr:sel1 repeat family protein [Nitrosomonas sp.]